MKTRIQKISFVAIAIAVMAFTAASCGTSKGGQGKKNTNDRNDTYMNNNPGDRG